jgi:hypothetical protein
MALLISKSSPACRRLGMENSILWRSVECGELVTASGVWTGLGGDGGKGEMGKWARGNLGGVILITTKIRSQTSPPSIFHQMTEKPNMNIFVDYLR